MSRDGFDHAAQEHAIEQGCDLHAENCAYRALSVTPPTAPSEAAEPVDNRPTLLRLADEYAEANAHMIFAEGRDDEAESRTNLTATRAALIDALQLSPSGRTQAELDRFTLNLFLEAYARGEQQGGSMDWEDLDQAYSYACQHSPEAVAEAKARYPAEDDEEEAEEDERETPEDSPSIANCDDAGTGEGRWHGRM